VFFCLGKQKDLLTTEITKVFIEEHTIGCLIKTLKYQNYTFVKEEELISKIKKGCAELISTSFFMF
jgi:hypothetical protein